jgi:hypothetical protein
VLSSGSMPFLLSLQTTSNENTLIKIMMVGAILNVLFFQMYGTIGIDYSALMTFGMVSILQIFMEFETAKT